MGVWDEGSSFKIMKLILQELLIIDRVGRCVNYYCCCGGTNHCIGGGAGLAAAPPGVKQCCQYRSELTSLATKAFRINVNEELTIFLSVVGVVTRLLAGRFAVRIPTGTGDFSLPRVFRTSSVAHSARYSMGIVVLSRG